MGWIDSGTFRELGPLLCDELERRQPAQCLQATCLVEGTDEVLKKGPELVRANRSGIGCRWLRTSAAGHPQ